MTRRRKEMGFFYNKFLLFGGLAVFCVVVIASGIIFHFISGSNQLNTIIDSAKIQEELLEANKDAIVEEETLTPKVRDIDEDDYILGNKAGLVEIIIYEDFYCPFCREFYSTIKKIEEKFGDKVQIAFRHFPLRSSAYSYQASLASECAGNQGNFWEMVDKIFNEDDIVEDGKEKFKRYAKDLGLNEEEFNECIDKEKFLNKIEGQIGEAKELGVVGAPSFFINKKFFPGAYPFEDFVNSLGEEKFGLENIIIQNLKN